VDAAEKGVRSGYVALTQIEGIPPTQVLNTKNRVLDAIAMKHRAYMAVGQLYNAELALTEAMRFATDVQLPINYLASLIYEAGKLRFAQREFALSEALMRKADAIWNQLGWIPADSSRVATGWNTAKALIGQKKWAQALQEIEKLGRVTKDGKLLKDGFYQAYDRAAIYFGNGRYRDAIPLFEASVRLSRQNFGDSHFYTAQAEGLLGAALWRNGTAEDKTRALPLLKASVLNYMAPANADFLENIGIRKELREIAFAAYLEAMSSTPGEDATQAMGAADWVRGGPVQEALNDAAVRAAANTPALAEVVRRDQDARNEIKGLRSFLSGGAGVAQTPLPQIAAQMQERIAVLEGQRNQLQAEIKGKFANYDRLVHPTAPTTQDVARRLAPDQAMLMLLPTTDAMYVWAVTSDRPPAFVRVQLSEAGVNQLVARLRRQLDFAAGGGSQFDSAAAFELYDKLLTPLAPNLQGKTQWLVAAGGSLSQLPFAVLQTRSGGGVGSNAPWLVRDVAIAQVPSLSAWLAIKSIATVRSASQPFAAWGDPAFGTNTVTQSSASAGLVRNVALTRSAVVSDLEGLQSDNAAAPGLKYADIPPLPDTRQELLAIAATLHADAASDVLLGARATRESVMAASKSGQLAHKRVIAFATHGLMAGDLPNLNQPALALAAMGVEAQNPLAPLLTLEDVLTLKLNADWVVLSACNTAAADGKAEEALSGLARGFFYAGGRSLLVTHWAVESQSAKLLTTNTFAHYIANSAAPKAESLRQAMLQVMADPKYAHPAYWAPYALVGDSGR
jgi:CHAT domain-containing protein/tetratricopeptide (TPR) repeat protein